MGFFLYENWPVGRFTLQPVCIVHLTVGIRTSIWREAEAVPHCSQGLWETGLSLDVTIHACHFLTLCTAMLQNNVAELQVHVAGSSIAMLQGQRPPFRLLVRATGVRDGRRVEYVKPAVSDAFVVSRAASVLCRACCSICLWCCLRCLKPLW